MSKHVACGEALHKAVLSAAVPLADLAVNLQGGLMHDQLDTHRHDALPADNELNRCRATENTVD